jgi:hypothetical protein
MGLLDGNYQDERLTKKVKPAIQGGGYNYLGKQETVTVPKRWLSDPDHVVAELAYITPREAKVLLDLNLYGSLDGKPNNAPGGLPSLQGDMGSVGGGGSSSGGGGNSGGGGRRNNMLIPIQVQIMDLSITTNLVENKVMVVVMVDILIEYKEYQLVLNQDIHQQVLNLLE